MRKMTASAFDLRHQAQRSSNDADQAEFSALKNGSSVVDFGVYDERVAGALDDFEPRDPSIKQIWHAEDLKYDAAVGGAHEEIERRITILGESYPFEFADGTLRHRDSDFLLYDFFLSICNAGNISSGKFVELPRLFERITARIAASFFGVHTKHIHTGYPRENEVGKSFKNAMEYVADETGEWTWGPDDGLPEEPSIGGDGGCDFVAWVAPPDNRKIGQIFLLGQCACGNNWAEKLDDLNLKKLQKWFNPLSVVEPIRTFVTPFHITDATLIEVSREAGYVFDRARLVTTATRGVGKTIEAEFGDDIRSLIELVLD